VIVKKMSYIINRIQESRVLVIGDIGLDSYLLGNVKRISPEAPVPVVEVKNEYNRLGLAANVVNNIISLGGKSEIIGLVGNDRNASLLREELERVNIGVQSLIVDGGRHTTHKTRILASKIHHVVRLDKENTAPVSEEVKNKIIETSKDLIKRCDIVILQDYGKGFFKNNVMQDLIQLCNSEDTPVIVDPSRSSDLNSYKGATIIKPNIDEARILSGIDVQSEEDLYECGRVLLEKLVPKYLVITRGERGMTIFSRGQEPKTIPSFALQVYDVSGAGDTVVASIALAYSCGAPITDCIYFANTAAAIVVAKVGTSVATPDEIIKFLKEHSVK
jgi:rfaE bifunctional protein kinase chain/domain